MRERRRKKRKGRAVIFQAGTTSGRAEVVARTWAGPAGPGPSIEPSPSAKGFLQWSRQRKYLSYQTSEMKRDNITPLPASSMRQGPCLLIPSPGHLICKCVLNNKLMNVNECFHIHLSFTRVFPIQIFTEHLQYLGLQKRTRSLLSRSSLTGGQKSGWFQSVRSGREEEHAKGLGQDTGEKGRLNEGFQKVS